MKRRQRDLFVTTTRGAPAARWRVRRRRSGRTCRLTGVEGRSQVVVIRGSVLTPDLGLQLGDLSLERRDPIGVEPAEKLIEYVRGRRQCGHELVVFFPDVEEVDAVEEGLSVAGLEEDSFPRFGLGRLDHDRSGAVAPPIVPEQYLALEALDIDLHEVDDLRRVVATDVGQRPNLDFHDVDAHTRLAIPGGVRLRQRRPPRNVPVFDEGAPATLGPEGAVKVRVPRPFVL